MAPYNQRTNFEFKVKWNSMRHIYTKEVRARIYADLHKLCIYTMRLPHRQSTFVRFCHTDKYEEKFNQLLRSNLCMRLIRILPLSCFSFTGPLPTLFRAIVIVSYHFAWMQLKILCNKNKLTFTYKMKMKRRRNNEKSIEWKATPPNR